MDTRNSMPGIPGLPGLPWDQGHPSIDHAIQKLAIQPSGMTLMGGISDELLRQYNAKLMEKMGYMSRREVKRKDIVDLRPILDRSHIPDWQAPNPDINSDDQVFIVQDYYYCFIPCFQEGVYHVNSGRYIYWRMEDLDLERHRMMLFLQDYVYYSDGCGWQPGVSGIVGWRFGDPEDEASDAVTERRRMKCEFGHNDEAMYDYEKLYSLLDLDADLHWTALQKSDWENLVVRYSRATASMMVAKTGKDNLDSLAAMFTNYTVKVNRILSEHKKQTSSRPASEAEHKEYLAEKKAAPDKEAAKKIKERRVRVIGLISITSRERPKPGRRAVANYKKPAWKTRGHMRRLPSGKRTYVRESVHRRKALLNPETAAMAPEAPTPLTIRLEKPQTPEPEQAGGE